ncbi:MAG: MotA/TolQ/ExbB proton channel family protein [Candidatus Thiodiazotropha sp. (ex Ctena orbiculata)]|nr:MotA/TolQ/ExbB proton channel family protein [Candidatus Thiodiazotropha taylori]
MDILLNWLPLDALSLLERGGMILVLILLLSLLMWSLIIYLYLHIWWRNGDQVSDRCMPWLPLIISLVQILPMVGLLGTIEAMIELFHVIAQHGSGNIRGMAGGISQALITTMAGLMASLSGYYFSSDLQHRLSYHATPQESL